MEEKFADETICEIKNIIQKTEIKNALSQSRGKVYKFSLKVYAFVYDKIIFYHTVTLNMIHLLQINFL